MKHLLKTILFIHFIGLPFLTTAQNCDKYHIDNCRWADRSFLYSRQSRSAIFTPGMTSEFNIVVYGGEEYYLSVSGDRKLGDIRLRVFEDDQQNTQLYDNAEFNYEDFFYFNATTTRKLILEVSTKEPSKPDKAKKEYCVGVLIEFRDTDETRNNSKDDVGF